MDARIRTTLVPPELFGGAAFFAVDADETSVLVEDNDGDTEACSSFGALEFLELGFRYAFSDAGVEISI